MQGQSEFKSAWNEVEAEMCALYARTLFEKQLPILNRLFYLMGPIGREFLKEFTDSKCKEVVDERLRNSSTNAMGPTHHYGGARFYNELTYNPGIMASLRWMFRAKAHDGIHAIQWANCAALHANAWNKHTKFILSPRSDMLKLELTENDAYAKQLLLEQALEVLGQWDDKIDDVSKPDIRPKLIALLPDGTRQYDEATLQRLQQYAVNVLDEETRADGKTFKQAYRDVCLSDWENGILLRRSHNDMDNVEIVTLDEEDVMLLGSALEMHTFGKDPVETRAWLQRTLDPVYESRIQGLNAKYNIQETSLRTLGQALAARGMTKNEYLAAQRGERPAAPPPPAVQTEFLPHIASGADTSHPSLVPG